MHDMQPDNNQIGSDFDRGGDREGAMAKADLYKLANYSLKMFKKIQDEDQLEGWVQAKITKAADYIASVYHYLEYEMKISEYGSHLESAEVYSESQRAAIKNKLTEAKEKIKALKVAQAEKQQKSEKPKQVEEGMFGGDEQACEACGGTGHVMAPERKVPEEVKSKVATYNRKAKAFTAASHRIDRNKNGIPDDEEIGEDQTELKKTGDSKKTRTGTLTKTDTGVVHKNTSYTDGSDDEVNPQSGKGKKSHAKSQSAAEKKTQAPKQKQSPKSAKTWGMKDNEKFDNRDKEVDETYGQGVYAESKGKKPDFLDMDKDGDKKEPMKKAVADKKAGPKKGVNPFAKKDSKVEETLKGGQKNLDVDKDGKLEKSDFAKLRAKKDAKKTVKEGMFDSPASPQVQAIQQMLADPKYASNPAFKAQLEKRLKLAQDRASLDKGEVVGKDGKPVVPAAPEEFARQNPNFKEAAMVAESVELTRIKELSKLLG
jgi:hypothetical protein